MSVAHRTPANRLPILVSALPVLLLTACGGDEPRAAPDSTAPASAAPSPTGSLVPGTAVDGRNLDSCRDGECEVVVGAGDVLRFDGRLETDPLTVVESGGTFTITDASGFTASIHGGGRVQTGSVQIEVGESRKERTVIRVSPRG
ncbi:MAG: hypothetical protein FWJ90_14875 [Actinomadura sp.]